MERIKLNPYFILMVGVMAVSTSAIFVKVSTAEAGVIAFYRLFFTVLLMLPFVLLRNVKELPKVSKKDWTFSIFAGVLLAFHFILWFESLNYTSVTSSTVLVTLQPIFAFLGTFIFFKERFSAKELIGGAAAICGSAVIGWGDFQISGTALYGDLLALTACALITGYLLIGQDIRKRVSLTTYTFLVYLNSSVVLLVYCLLKGEKLYPFPANDWLYFLLLALIPNLLGHTLFNWSLKYISTSSVSMAILLEPVGAGFLAYLLLGEEILASQIIGGSIVIGGLLLFSIKGSNLKMQLKRIFMRKVKSS